MNNTTAHSSIERTPHRDHTGTLAAATDPSTPAHGHAGGTGRVYIAMTISGEACLFTAPALTAVQLPSLAFASFGQAGAGPLAPALPAAGFGIARVAAAVAAGAPPAALDGYRQVGGAVVANGVCG